MVAAAWGGRCVGVRLSPYWTASDRSLAGQLRDEYHYTAADQTLAGHDALVAELNERPVAYLHLRGRAPSAPGTAPDFDAIARYRKLFDGLLIANHGFGRETGNAMPGSEGVVIGTGGRPDLSAQVVQQCGVQWQVRQLLQRLHPGSISVRRRQHRGRAWRAGSSAPQVVDECDYVPDRRVQHRDPGGGD